MNGDYGMNPGTALLARAIGHATFHYGGQVGDYDDIISASLRGRHAAPVTTHSDYLTGRARDLIGQARSGQLDHDPRNLAGWVGSATVILEELTRDA